MNGSCHQPTRVCHAISHLNPTRWPLEKRDLQQTVGNLQKIHAPSRCFHRRGMHTDGFGGSTCDMFGAFESRVRRLCFVCVSFENKAKEQKKRRGRRAALRPLMGGSRRNLGHPRGVNCLSATVVKANPPVYQNVSLVVVLFVLASPARQNGLGAAVSSGCSGGGTGSRSALPPPLPPLSSAAEGRVGVAGHRSRPRWRDCPGKPEEPPDPGRAPTRGARRRAPTPAMALPVVPPEIRSRPQLDSLALPAGRASGHACFLPITHVSETYHFIRLREKSGEVKGGAPVHYLRAVRLPVRTVLVSKP